MKKEKSFMIVSCAILCFVLALWPVFVMADPARAEAQYRTCAACHGQMGEGGVGPSLIGKPSDYLYSRLMQYKAGETVGPQSVMMWGQVANLSSDDLQGLANYVEKLSRPVIED
jgi:cytochrome c553